MKLIGKNLILNSNLVSFVWCLIMALFVMTSALALSDQESSDSNSILNDDLTHSIPSHRSQWQTSPQRVASISLHNQQPPAKHLLTNGRSTNDWLRFYKRQKVEDPPPGFVGTRGRRAPSKTVRDYSLLLNGRRFPADAYKTLNEVLPHLWPQIKDQTEPVTEELIAARLSSDKKSDNIVYKDGFLGVRGR